MKNKTWIWLLVVLGLGGLIAYLIKRNSATQTITQALAPPGALQPQNSYDNEEVREIEYNRDGLPTKITIHRHARAA